MFLSLGCVAVAQHTSVENNGLAGRIETDYNSAGKATEMRTLSADGKLQQKTDYEYRPGYYGAQQTDTTYWPNGKIRKVTRHTYDPSTNFTGEFIEAFDESGKQTGGHKLAHDPWTGIYQCAEWSSTEAGYKEVKCPSGEEEAGGGKEIRKVTYDEVIKNLQSARAGATRKDPAEQPFAGASERKLGLILPAHLRAGERVSGSVVEDPEHYEEAPEVQVFSVVLPPAGKASRLSDWEVKTPGESAQPADGPVSFVVPAHDAEIDVTFQAAQDADETVSKKLILHVDAKKPPANSFRAAALCMKDQLCEVTGPFSGDSRKTFASFEDRAVTIVAESSDAIYLKVPELTEPGSRMLFLETESKAAALPVVVGEVVVKDDGRQLKAGETLVTDMTMEGPSDLPEVAWREDSVDDSKLESARRLVPDLEVARDRDDKDEAARQGEAKEEEGGEILIVLKNKNPQQFLVRGSKNDALVFRLSEEAFERGEFKYNLVVEAKEAGQIDIRGYVFPSLAPVAGQEFTLQAPSR